MGFFTDDLPDYISEHSYFGPLKTFGIKGELRYLSAILTDNEEVLALTRGGVDGRWWIMAVTNLRVVLVHRGLIYGLKYLEVPIFTIKSVSYKTGMFYGTIFIDTGAGTVVMDSIHKKAAAEVSSILCEAVGDTAHSLPNGARSTVVLDQLERLASLRDKGALTEAEFLAQKEKILAHPDVSATPAKYGPGNGVKPKSGPTASSSSSSSSSLSTDPARSRARVETLPEAPPLPGRGLPPEVK
ncbi:MAG: PH domain-containing protein, partial [Deltaproteobacteria bacterium]|nr:PH domain-containing protein [Deltaproteobacteria bacterium]